MGVCVRGKCEPVLLHMHTDVTRARTHAQVLGRMYRRVKEIRMESTQVGEVGSLDPTLLIQGYHDYIEDAMFVREEYAYEVCGASFAL